MDENEDCTSCRVLYNQIVSKFKLAVLQSPDVYTEAFCAGLVDLAKVSTLYPIDVMALDRTVRSVQGGGEFRLVVYFFDRNKMFLGILHERQSVPADTAKGLFPTLWSTQQKDAKRVCLYSKDELAGITRRVTSDQFYYDGVPETNLGYIRSSNPHEHRVFDLTAWLNALTGLRKYPVLNVWCYANANANAIEKRFAVEVITDCKKLKPETKHIEDRESHRTGFSLLTVSIVGVIGSSLALWMLSFMMLS